MKDSKPVARQAFHVMAKPIGPICNLDCSYCFYLEKEKLFSAGENFKMSDEMLDIYIRQYIESQPTQEIQFAWQGGEPTLLGISFFRKVVALQQKYGSDRQISNAFQTNGTLLDDEWCEFFAENRFLIGLSLDGPAHLHDRYRMDKKQRPTFDRVIRGLALLKKYGVEFNTLTVVSRANSKHPLEVYHFLKEIGSGFLQFIPLVKRQPNPSAQALHLQLAVPGTRDSSADVTEWSVRAPQYGEFLCTIFDEWVRHDVGRVFVQIFDVALGAWMHQGPSICVFAERCGKAVAMEHNGDIYSCDHFVYPQYKLGNLLGQQLGELVSSPRQEAFGNSKLESLPAYCRECEVRFACNGGCPKHRFIRTPRGEPGLNYMCAAYKRFFRHIDPYMRTMAHLLQAKHAPAEIMEMLTRPLKDRSVGRNDPCPCGSRRKYKACCLSRSN